MSRDVMRVGWFRFRAALRRRLGGYVAVALLIGFVGGLAMSTIAAARRTQSSYNAFLGSTDPSDVTLQIINNNSSASLSTSDVLKQIEAIRQLQGVKHVESYAQLNAYPLNPDGTLNNVSVPIDGSIDGLYFHEDRITVTSGRLADPSVVDEVVMSADVAAFFGLHVGSVVSWGFYDNADATAPGLFSPKQAPHLRVDLHVVGIGVLNTKVVQDDIDADSAVFVLFTPALTQQLLACCVQNIGAALQLSHGGRDVATVEKAITAAQPPGVQLSDTITSVSVAKIERALQPESIALGVFGLIAGFAALLIATQVIGRQFRLRAGDLEAMRGLGASPAMMAIDGLVGAAGAIVAGSLLAGTVAVALSPLGPIGPVRRLYPFRGIAWDWTVLGIGMATMVVVLGGVAVVFAVRGTPHRVAKRLAVYVPRPSRTARLATAAGLPTSAVTGVRFALEPGRGRDTVPVRSAIFGATLAVVVVVSTLVFGASLHTLVSRPALYGWNWDYELIGGGGVGAIPDQQSAARLNADRDVAAWSAAYFWGVELDGVTVHIIGMTPNAVVQPPLLSGHGLEAKDEVVLGAVTLAQLHKHVGETVIAATESGATTMLRIVGTATMPTVGFSGFHPTMGEGAVVSYQLIADQNRDPTGNSPAGPEAIFVRLRPGVDRVAALAGLKSIATSLTGPTNYGVDVSTVRRPAEIVNYRATGSTPTYLSLALAVGAMVALALTLIASVRRRRRDLAVLKTLGFTRGQLAASVAWQSTATVGIGVLLGVPVGILIGRTLWDLFAKEIHAVPRPAVSSLTIAVVVAGALVLANVVAAIPARSAARTTAAQLLRVD